MIVDALQRWNSDSRRTILICMYSNVSQMGIRNAQNVFQYSLPDTYKSFIRNLSTAYDSFVANEATTSTVVLVKGEMKRPYVLKEVMEFMRVHGYLDLDLVDNSLVSFAHRQNLISHDQHCKL